MTLSQILQIEPRVADILKSAKTVKNANDFTYEKFKGYLAPLVGFESAKKELQTCGAYEITINALCNALNV